MENKEHASPRILIIKPSSLGDIIHALPTVNLIRRHYPQAHIAWLVNTAFASLLKKCPIIDEIILFDRQRYASWLKVSQFTEFLASLRSRRFDLVVDLQGLFRSGFIAMATAAPRRIGLSDSRECARLFHNEIVSIPNAHAVDRYLQAARHLGAGIEPVEFPLGLPPATAKRELIAINPCSRWVTKLWGHEKFAELIRQLPRERIVLTGSATEAPGIAQIAQGCRNLAGQTDLLELADLYRSCRVVITNDSGPMHLAAAVGTPVVAIFGPTDPALTGPFGSGHVVLRVSLPCAPCQSPQCKNPIRLECMQQVSVAAVRAAVEPFLAL